VLSGHQLAKGFQQNAQERGGYPQKELRRLEDLMVCGKFK